MSLNQRTAASEVVMEMVDVAVGSLRNPDRMVLEGVNWQVIRGDFFAVGGLLGSGKSDLLLVAGGIMSPLRGRYRLFGQELTGQFTQAELRARLRLGFVFDGGQLLSHLTLAENIALPARYHENCLLDDCQEMLKSLMQFAGLEHLGGHYPGEVSRNWQQRAGLARALALRPEVLLLDNPLSGQDPQHTQWWLDRLGALWSGHPVMQNRPITLVVTCPDLRPWRSVARQGGILKRRRLVTAPPCQPFSEALEQLHGDLVSEEEGLI